jgi:hypothetical protein
MVDVATKTRLQANGLAGTLWFGGWLFTIAFAKLVWWKAILGLAAVFVGFRRRLSGTRNARRWRGALAYRH